jgi:hypothetical protein
MSIRFSPQIKWPVYQTADQQCKSWAKDYGVRPFVTNGTLPAAAQLWWNHPGNLN